MATKIPTTITQLRKAAPGWKIEYGTMGVYTHGKRIMAHKINCFKKVSWRGAFFAVPMVNIRLTNKAAAVAMAYAAMEARDA